MALLPPALLPCPFCSAAPIRARENGQHFIKCPSCRTTGPKAQTVDEAERKWNHRPYRIAVQASAAARTDQEINELFTRGES